MSTPQTPTPELGALAELPQHLRDANLTRIQQQLDSGELSMLGQYVPEENLAQFQLAVQSGDIENARAAVAGIEIPGVGELSPKKKRSPMLAVVIVVLVLIAAGVAAWLIFGGSDTENIPDTLSADSDFTTMSELLDTAGLTDLLGETGPFTVFAPTNDAWAAFNKDEMAVLRSDTDKLRSVLLYQITTGEHKTENMPATLPTQGSGDLKLETSGSTVTVNGVKIVKPDVEATNGLIQGVEAVLVPPGLDLSTAPTDDIVELISGNPNYSTLASLIASAGLTNTLTSAGPFTLFAPQNTAFEAMPPDQLATLTGNPEILRSVLNYHIVAGSNTTEELKTGQLNSLEGSTLDVVVNGGDVTVNGAKVVDPNLAASNGVVQGINAVLIPPGVDLIPTTTTTESTTTSSSIPPSSTSSTTSSTTTTSTTTTTAAP